MKKPRDPYEYLTIAVLTYRRPDDLAAILQLLRDQAGRNAGPNLSIQILVVDNDPDGGAASQVRSFGEVAGREGALDQAVTVHYLHEQIPGISAARNRALREAEDSGLLVFIDDDERPTENWLALLLETWRTTRAAAVVGPVISDYEIEPEPWIVAGEYFSRRRLPTGTRVDVAGTNNLLLDLEFVRSHELSFDAAFGLSGGGDTLFTRQLISAGGAIVWCDEAIVLDMVPAKRLTRRWVVLRALRSGNSWATTSVELARTPADRTVQRIRLSARGGIRVLGGSFRIVAGMGLGRIDLRARGVRTLMRGAGMISGAWGYTYVEYRRPTISSARR